MGSSVMHLSLSSVFALVGIAMITWAFCTASWVEYQVNRREIINAFNREPELNVRLKDAFTRNVIYFPRNYGLLHICFPEAVPSDIGSFSWIGSPCVNNMDYFPSEAAQEQFSNPQILRLWLKRATFVCYCLGMFAVCLCLITGSIGCYRRSVSSITLTSVLLLFSVVFLCSAMGCWHYIVYMENNSLEVKPFYKTWEPILKATASYHFGYSYVVSWVGIAFLILATIFMFLSRHYMKKEDEKDLCNKQYMIPNYYDKTAMMPYGYNTYGGYGTAFPYYANQYSSNGYYGYMTYGR